MTRCCVYLRSKLSKFLHDVLAEPARFYFWRFLRRLELPRGDANDPCQESGSARVSGLLLREPRDSSGKEPRGYSPSKRQSGSDLRASSQKTRQRHYPSH